MGSLGSLPLLLVVETTDEGMKTIPPFTLLFCLPDEGKTEERVKGSMGGIAFQGFAQMKVKVFIKGSTGTQDINRIFQHPVRVF